MSTARRTGKHTLKEDQLVTWAVEASQWAQKHFNQIVIGLVVLVAAIAIIMFSSSSRQSAARQSETQLSSAMSLYQQGDFAAAAATFEQVKERSGGRVGAMATYFLAESRLAQREYEQAEQNYAAFLNNPGELSDFVLGAKVGQAVASGNAGNFEDAGNALWALLDEFHGDDPRYADTAFQAGEFFAKAQKRSDALRCYQLVMEKGTGMLRDQAAAKIPFFQ